MPDIVVPGGSSSGSAKSKTTPRSGGMPQTGESSSMGDSRHSTPRVGSARAPHPIDTATPPFSPFPPRPGAHVADSPGIPPKSLPTPPPHTRSASSSKARESSRPPPLSATSSTSKYLVVTQSAEQFATGGVERFQAFAAKEAAASSDADRVRMFADFIVNESRIRRERYSTAIGAMGSEIFDLTRDLFRPMVAARRESTTSHGEWTPESSEPNRSHRGSISSVRPDEPSSAPSSARLPPSPSGTAAQNNANYASNYMPSLSPILSMSVSDNHDGSSRGRPSSRWWETESAQGDPSRKFERSKRESKYMGVPKEQWVEVDSNVNPESESSSEYPPEKTGWHDQSDEAACTPKPSRFSQVLTGSSPSPVPQNADHLDVSRLVTMPPPYPRHHPAVNNNHPELASIRTSVRALTDLTEVDQAKEDFTLKSSKRRDDFSKEANERKQALRANLQQEINSGNLGYADAAAIESDSQDQERAKQKELEKNEYEHFQNEVIMPLNELLTSRIAKATELHDDLAKRLFDSSQLDADMPQEEGDDRPELLEKLTLLKWIFEARESLHKAIYDLLTERNTRYSDVVMTPYRLSGNAEKLKSAEEFFAGDAAKREHAYAYEVLDRSRAFRGVMDEAVQRGVALQLSAFWDIAPPLCRLLEKVPSELEGFNIQIPLGEFEENPAYYDHPMQYLFSLLLHTEKSTYQFIEAHTNLLCLLHEVKEAVVHAKAKVLATQTVEADGTAIRAEVREERAAELRQHEARRLTEDLKEQVRVVQDQWSSALGDCIRSVKERSRGWLLETGGWDETLETDS
ncbi:hypothetical protein N3K66_005027 [Trichothecium roseum]|uniref:Uncharacterized protein n=1 Tax=Trichothecium roseum TaxID=47278 RepID=A0ACC0V300_9HYPO|nr:hypothetical protein N3K66_005027 [Trichothecium roseum]